MSGPFAWAKAGSVLAGEDMDGRRFIVERHGEGRKYWGVTYPDGTYTHNALTQTEAKQQAEAWTSDPSLVALVDARSVQADAPPAGDVSPSGSDDVTAAAVASGDLDPVELVDLVVQAAHARELQRGGRGWGYQDAGDGQRRALVAITELAALRSAVETAIRAQVAVARHNTGSSWYSNAATWADIGAALGVTKQSAQAKYGRTA